MAIYHLDQASQARAIRHTLMFKRLLIGVLLLCAPIAAAWRYTDSGYINAIGRPTFWMTVVSGVLLWVTSGVLKIRRTIGSTLSITVSPDGVMRHDGVREDLLLTCQEIIGFTESQYSRGIVLRTADPHRWIQIGRDVDNYAACRAEIVAMGIRELPRSWMRPFLLQIVALSALFFVMRATVGWTTNPIIVAGAVVLFLAVVCWFSYRRERGSRQHLASSLSLILFMYSVSRSATLFRMSLPTFGAILVGSVGLIWACERWSPARSKKQAA